MAEPFPAVRPATAVVMLTLTALMWAGNAVAARLAIGEVSPMLLTLMRWAGAVVLLLPFTWRRVLADRAALARAWLFILAMGTVGYSGFNILLYTAAATTTAVNIAIIQAAMPMLIFAINLAVFAVRIRMLQVAGYLLTLLGVALVAGQGDLAGLARLAVTEGDALMLVASVMYAGYTVALKRRLSLHPLSFLTAMCAAATLAAVPAALWEGWQGARLVPASPLAWGVVAYTVVAASVVSQWFYMTGVAALGANRAGLFINLVPVFGAGLAVAILGEVVAAYQALALLLVLGGILVAQAAGGRG